MNELENAKIFLGYNTLLDYVIIGFIALFGIFWILDRFGILNPTGKKLEEIKDIVRELLIIYKDGYLRHPSQTDIVKHFSTGRIDSLKTGITKSFINIHMSLDGNEDEEKIKKLIRGEIVANITEIDNNMYKLPNIKDTSISKDAKINEFMKNVDVFIDILKNEKEEKTVTKRIRGIVDVIIRNGNF